MQQPAARVVRAGDAFEHAEVDVAIGTDGRRGGAVVADARGAAGRGIVQRGDGSNRVAVLDPNATQIDPISLRPVMQEVLSILGPTFESGSSGPVKEWCINTAAVDPLTFSVLVNSEDGYLYRWDLRTNTFTQRIQLTSGIAESYTPTAIGADGAVYAVNNAVIFSIGQ